MKVIVAECNWQGARTADIDALLTNAASHFVQAFRSLPKGEIVVKATLLPSDSPMTVFRSSSKEPFTILLSARGRYWCKFSYQFSHELCHVLSGYERLQNSRNKWFHEALCELASVFTIRRMAETWPIQPPFSDWAGYAESLASYAENLLVQEVRQLPGGTTLSGWLNSEEEALRQDCYLRDKNAVVANSLLPIFESDPKVWNAIRNLPDSSAMFQQYLLEWLTSVNLEDKPRVKRIIDAFA